MTTAEQMPKPAFRLKWRGKDAAYFVDKPNIGDTDCYTFEQLRAYAAQEVARLLPALIGARDGYIAEAATGLPCLPTWRDNTLTELDEAIALVAAIRARNA